MSFISYVLTLEGSIRSQRLVNQSRELGLHLNLCMGLKGSEFTEDEFKTLAPVKQAEFLLGRRIGRNELACLLGHLKIYRKFLDETSASWCLVLEDDAEINPKLLEFLWHTSKFPSNSIIHLAPQQDITNFVLQTLTIDDVYSSFIINKVLDFVPRTHGYLIDRTAASTAIKSSKANNYYFTADWPFNWVRKVNFWVTSDTYVNILDGDFGSAIYQERSILESTRERELFMRALSRVRFLNWAFNGLGITAIYGKSIGIPFKVTYQELFLMSLKRKKYKYQVK